MSNKRIIRLCESAILGYVSQLVLLYMYIVYNIWKLMTMGDKNIYYNTNEK